MLLTPVGRHVRLPARRAFFRVWLVQAVGGRTRCAHTRPPNSLALPSSARGARLNAGSLTWRPTGCGMGMLDDGVTQAVVALLVCAFKRLSPCRCRGI